MKHFGTEIPSEKSSFFLANPQEPQKFQIRAEPRRECVNGSPL